MSDRRNHKHDDLSQRAFQRILIIKPSSLGDVIHALPVLHGLRARFPSAVIDWLIATPFAPLVDSHPDLNETIPFDRRRYGRIGWSPSATWEFMRFTKRLRKRRYDLTVDLQGLFRSGYLSWASRAPVRIGFRSAREGAWLFYTHRVDVPDPDAHAVDKNYLVGRQLGFNETPIEFRLYLSQQVRDQVASLLAENGLGSSRLPVVIAPGARWETKRWPPSRFAETIDRLVSIDGVSCAVVGGPDEVDLCRQIVSLCKTRPVDLSGRTTLPQLAALIERAGVVLCHDSAAAHLAVALNRPVVCITGPTSPSRTGPYGRLDDVIRLDLDCSPCYLRRLERCMHGHRCMQDLAVSDVVQALRDRLEAKVPS